MLESQTAPEEISSVSEGQDDVKTPTEASTGESSTEVKGVEQNKPTLLDAVRNALKDGSEKSPDSELTPDTKTGTATKAADDKAELEDGEEVPAEEMKQYSRGAQYRIRQLSAQRKAETERVKELQPKAEIFDRLSTVMQRDNLNGEDIDVAVEVAGLMKTDPVKALEKLAPIVKKLLAATGHQLPDDLKAKVEAGALSEADARELSTARSRASHLTATSEQREQQRQQEDEQRHAETVIDTAVKTADAWHAEKAKTDPDWHLKQQRVLDGVELEILKTKRFPQSDKEARDIFEKVLKAVETDLKRFLPRKQAVTPSSGSASPDAQPKPTSLHEAVRMALRK